MPHVKHKAVAAVIMCMDFRFQEKTTKHLNSANLEGKFDKLSIPGGTRDFISPITPEHGDYVWNALKLSIDLHDPDEIIFVDHQDCGAYAADNAIPGGLGMNEDLEAHKKYFKELKKVIEKKYPDKKIRFQYVPFEGDVMEIDV